MKKSTQTKQELIEDLELDINYTRDMKNDYSNSTDEINEYGAELEYLQRKLDSLKQN